MNAYSNCRTNGEIEAMKTAIFEETSDLRDFRTINSRTKLRGMCLHQESRSKGKGQGPKASSFQSAGRLDCCLRVIKASRFKWALANWLFC
ncbi:unnamed protein product [Cuscuta europaea]|uniref:Uncharacterized protein n=1 Tax=Cuscuta europaea TaxID=41803 RepID=A0A9P0YW57_CUSEU|nr:unnamed protein product [Cuscuta europaea]